MLRRYTRPTVVVSVVLAAISLTGCAMSATPADGVRPTSSTSTGAAPKTGGPSSPAAATGSAAPRSTTAAPTRAELHAQVSETLAASAAAASEACDLATSGASPEAAAKTYFIEASSYNLAQYLLSKSGETTAARNAQTLPVLEVTDWCAISGQLAPAAG